MNFDFTNGEILLFDKPLGWTSFDVVNKVRLLIRRHLGIKKIKVGHAGTLDPLATGLLILCTGKFTKNIDSIQTQEKTYTGTIMLGATTPSFDLETEVDAQYPTNHLTEEILRNATQAFTGTIQQIPPQFSAIKIDGVRAYEKARKNEEVKLKAREVHIYDFELTRIQLPEIDFKISCSKGTYIRSIARDFSKSVGSGGHLTHLVRTRIGKYDLADSLTINDFEKKLDHIKC